MSPEERQRTDKVEAMVRGISLVVTAGVLALVAFEPSVVGSHGSVGRRALGAAALVGAAGSAMRGFGLRGSRRHVRILTHPAFSWSAAIVGLAGGFLA